MTRQVSESGACAPPPFDAARAEELLAEGQSLVTKARELSFSYAELRDVLDRLTREMAELRSAQARDIKALREEIRDREVAACLDRRRWARAMTRLLVVNILSAALIAALIYVL